jgi:hypothetical protein
MEALGTKVRTAMVAVLALAIAAIFLGAGLRWGMRCDEDCYLRSTVPGDPWTRSESVPV